MTIYALMSHFSPGCIEYHRNALALLPEQGDPDPGLAVLVIDHQRAQPVLQCNCSSSGNRKKCAHIKKLSKGTRKTPFLKEVRWLDDMFRQSPYYRMAVSLHNACPIDPLSLAVETTYGDSENENEITRVQILNAQGEMLVDCCFNGADAGKGETALLMERTGIERSSGNRLHRGDVLDRLARLTLTDAEAIMYNRGLKNRRMALEESFWYRLAYHFQNASAAGGVSIDAGIDDKTGRFVIVLKDGRDRAIEIAVPKNAAMRVRQELEKDFHKGFSVPVWSQSLESIVRVHADNRNNLKLNLYLLLHMPDGTTRPYERRPLKKFWYGNTAYIPDQKVLATWKTPDRLWETFGGKYSKKIPKDRLPEIIEKIGDIFSPPNIVDESVQRLKIHQVCNRIEIDPTAVDRDWCWLSVKYGFGDNASVSLTDIYDARMNGRRWLDVDDGWVDAWSVDLDAVTGQPGTDISRQLAAGNRQLKMSRVDLFRLHAAFETPVTVNDPGDGDDSGSVAAILEMRPPAALTNLSGMSCSLREYQRHGAQWLAFLHQNRFGGLLCDEMGLGKTHQVMALMVWLLQNNGKTRPGLVVCPTTVLSHWERKIREYAPGLCGMVYYGTDREIGDLSAPGSVLITSYGILMRDSDQLAKIHFSVAAFDEAQYLKNPQTKSHEAAATVMADLKIAVTGTPIENRIGDLKALMDIVLPGYLGDDSAFTTRYDSGGKGRRGELRRLIAPFTLRRTKSAVLDELPAKIEDTRYCQLTEAQVRLYRDAIAGRGAGLLSRLERMETDIPYIHIFALLTLLKQICNHPGSLSRKKAGMDTSGLDSGKWELFVELLTTCLDNGKKVVVFSQFITMVEMILDYLKGIDVQTACITGKTRNRGREIDRFNDDPDCRVFVGSLKAGGSGIDLIGGSVVIHYDRWWNAAREDQATDRVHRIGQTRGVQVFKLVTEGTLEEKIAAIIDRKKNLMDDVIAKDDPGVLKTFTREELIELISMPE